MFHVQVVLAALDIDRQRRALPILEHLLVQGVVTLHGRYVGQRHGIVFECWKRADMQGDKPEGAGGPFAGGPGLLQLVVHAAEHAGCRWLRCRVDLEVKTGQLRNHERVIQCFQEGLVLWSGFGVAVQQPAFQLESTGSGGIVKAIVPEAVLQLSGFVIQPFAEMLPIFLAELRAIDFLTHG